MICMDSWRVCPQGLEIEYFKTKYGVTVSWSMLIHTAELAFVHSVGRCWRSLPAHKVQPAHCDSLQAVVSAYPFSVCPSRHHYHTRQTPKLPAYFMRTFRKISAGISGSSKSWWSLFWPQIFVPQLLPVLNWIAVPCMKTFDPVTVLVVTSSILCHHSHLELLWVITHRSWQARWHWICVCFAAIIYVWSRWRTSTVISFEYDMSWLPCTMLLGCIGHASCSTRCRNWWLESDDEAGGNMSKLYPHRHRAMMLQRPSSTQSE